MTTAINHPSHYASGGLALERVQLWDAIKRFAFTRQNSVDRQARVVDVERAVDALTADAIAAAREDERRKERARCIQAAHDAAADGVHDASAAACCERIVAAIRGSGADDPGEGR